MPENAMPENAIPENCARLGRLEPTGLGAKWLADAGITAAYVYEIPMTTQFRGITSRDGLILQGAAGLAEAAPFWNYPPDVALRWFEGAFAVATKGLPAAPAPTPLNVTVPIVEPATAVRLVETSGCLTAKVKVADPRASLEEDVARLRAVRDALGASGKIRVDANAAWTNSEAREALPRLVEAAGGLEYAEQPCRKLADLAALQELGVAPIAADESIRLAASPERALREVMAACLAAAVVKAMPLGGPTRVRNLISESLASSPADLPTGTGQNGKSAPPASNLQTPANNQRNPINNLQNPVSNQQNPANNLPNNTVNRLPPSAAENRGPLIVVSSALDSGVGLLAGMSLAASLQVEAACGLGTGRLMRGGILVEEPRIEDGQLLPPTKVELNLDLPAPSPEQVQRWRSRVEEIAKIFPMALGLNRKVCRPQRAGGVGD
ncbi:MAG: enolase C-terminal domain-like protein [Mobiluncus porci]|uniref:enolase C-terminal domain-like protein n=1 Tax=Mobiluncus porci TaxID=2652278 RepID=UPI0023F1414A|nr:enolase C-terminal domain-like protein [Mobiluncus porci]MDD7540620.1 enolase C-terminal domain-like protein [Mobiluncus porci]MDY5748745.1 enolase C-terminal domain-like protein [Mobiluncus porci]